MATLFPFDSMSSCWTWAANLSRAWAYGRMALQLYPKKVELYNPSNPSNTGKFYSNGVLLKCKSIA